MLKDVSNSDAGWKIICLRYFNPVGAHESGLIGEDPNGLPNNLMPYIAQVAAGKLPHVNIYGNNYPTADGTGVRDYIHVVDLAEGHLAALNFLVSNAGIATINLGVGFGHSVLEIIGNFEFVSKKTIPYKMAQRRVGDIASCFAKVELAKQKLLWSANRDLKASCMNAWEWELKRDCL
jgi:UDP-glucose 4-epimerase